MNTTLRLINDDHMSTIIVATTEPQRLDCCVVAHSDMSRTQVQKRVEEGHILVNGSPARKASMKIVSGDTITVLQPQKKAPPLPNASMLDAMQIDIIAEYEHFMVIAKPAGLVVHKPATNASCLSLADWLVHRYPEITHVGDAGRPGIVHRLDKDTSGLMLVARTSYGLKTLQAMFVHRTIKKTYLGLVNGHPQESGTIDYNIDRNTVIPTQMTHKIDTGRHAITHYKVLRYFKQHAVAEFTPLTGRTHQIRVHCAAIGHPIVGDTVYGTSSKLIKRHALHAAHLAFTFDEQAFEFSNNIPYDFQHALQQLEQT